VLADYLPLRPNVGDFNEPLLPTLENAYLFGNVRNDMTVEKSVPAPAPPTSETRRSFLKTTSALFAGGTLVGGQLPLARAAHAYGSDVIKLGLIGCGGRGTGAAGEAMSTEGPTKLVAIADAFESRSSTCLGQLKKKNYAKQLDDNLKISVGLDAYKDVLDSDCDLVILATPPGFRPLHFEAAINAGKNVFAEKPVATDAPGIRRFLETNKVAKEKGLTVQVGLQRHHQTDYRETIKMLKDGAIGEILFTRVYWNTGAIWTRGRTEGMTELEYQIHNWYHFNWLSGDHICEQHIHNLDVSNWLMDAHPIEVNGQGGRRDLDGYSGEIYDHHFVEYTYPNGAKMFSQCRQIPGCFGSVSEFAHGTKGWCQIDKGLIYDEKNNEKWKAPKGENGHANEHVDMFAAIRKGEIPNEGDYGATSTMTAIMGRMATYSGKKLSWDDCFNSRVSLADFDSLKSYQDPAPVQPLENGKYAIPMPGGDTSKIL